MLNGGADFELDAVVGQDGVEFVGSRLMRWRRNSAAIIGTVRNSVREAGFVIDRRTFRRSNGELDLGLEPLARRSFPFLGRMVQGQLQGRVVIGEMARDRTARRSLEFSALEDPAHALREGEERHDVLPVAPPGLGDCRIKARD